MNRETEGLGGHAESLASDKNHSSWFCDQEGVCDVVARRQSGPGLNRIDIEAAGVRLYRSDNQIGQPELTLGSGVGVVVKESMGSRRLWREIGEEEAEATDGRDEEEDRRGQNRVARLSAAVGTVG